MYDDKVEGSSGISGAARVRRARMFGDIVAAGSRGWYCTVSAGGTCTSRQGQRKVRGQQGYGADERGRVNVSTSVASELEPELQSMSEARRGLGLGNEAREGGEDEAEMQWS